MIEEKEDTKGGEERVQMKLLLQDFRRPYVTAQAAPVYGDPFPKFSKKQWIWLDKLSLTPAL
jgi:hypothetical protein